MGRTKRAEPPDIPKLHRPEPEWRDDDEDYAELEPGEPGDGRIVRKPIADESLWDQ